MLDLLHTLLTDYTLRTVALGAATLGLVGGALGSYAVLRGQSLLGDAVSHAALPGIALAFLLTGTKAPLVLMLGAAATGWVATLCVMGLANNTRISYDSALAVALSVFFGVGLVLLTYVQRHAGASQSGLDSFLFGQAAALVEKDLAAMATLGGGALAVMLLFWKEMKLLSFDRAFGESLGYPMQALDVLLTTLLVVAIVAGLQMVGVVLMSAVIVAPAAAARQWTDRLGPMVALAAVFGAGSGVAGAIASATVPNLPTGPTIVLCMGVVAGASLLAAPNRGLAWRRLRERRNAQRLRREAVLLDLLALAQKHGTHERAHGTATVNAMSAGMTNAAQALADLEADGFVERDAAQWRLTPAGLAKARMLAGDRTIPSASRPPR